MSLLKNLRTKLSTLNERRRLQHGWEVELLCPQCGTVAPPVFNGWDPNSNIGFGKDATIFANVTCSKCHAGLKDAAVGKLVEMFADEAIPPTNRKAIGGYLILTVAFLVCIVGRFFMRLPAFDWLYPVILVLFSSSAFWFTQAVHNARHQCECGNPSYLFMGMLGRSYCLRCSSCGKLLRLRD
jgi:hypothetical protein